MYAGGYPASMGYSGLESALTGVITSFLVIYAIIWTIMMLVGLVDYIFRGLAIYNMSKARGLEYGWLGFIPYARTYQLGQIAGEIEVGKKTIKNTGLWLLLAPFVFGFVVFIGVIIITVPTIFSTVALESNPTPEGVSGMLVTWVIAWCIFMVIVTIAQVFVYLIRYLALHKIFSHYSAGQKPVFYLIIAIFVPLAESILLFMHSRRPLRALEPASTGETESEVLTDSAPQPAPEG